METATSLHKGGRYHYAYFIDMGTIDVAHRCGQSLSNLAQITQLVSIRATLQCPLVGTPDDRRNASQEKSVIKTLSTWLHFT